MGFFQRRKRARTRDAPDKNYALTESVAAQDFTAVESGATPAPPAPAPASAPVTSGKNGNGAQPSKATGNPLLHAAAPTAGAPAPETPAPSPPASTATPLDPALAAAALRMIDGNAKAEPVIAVRELTKIYQMGDVEVAALRGVDLDIYPGEMTAIMGPSGSGKSTLMNIIGCLDTPTAGSYLLDGVDVSRLSDDALANIRGSKIGFVFQSFNLLARTTAQDNVELPLIYLGRSGRDRKRRSRQVLEMVGLGERMHHKPNELSGGQQQRVAIARALINEPAMILADEPTGNLDTKTSVEIMELFQRLNVEQGITIVFVTHNNETAEYCHRVIRVRDGFVESDVRHRPTAGIYSALHALTVAPATSGASAPGSSAAQTAAQTAESKP